MALLTPGRQMMQDAINALGKAFQQNLADADFASILDACAALDMSKAQVLRGMAAQLPPPKQTDPEAPGHGGVILGG